MPALSDSWEASSLLNLILSESFALIYSGHWYCKSNSQPCVRGKLWGIQCCAASATWWIQGSHVAQELHFCLGVTHSYVSPNSAFLGRRAVMQTLHVCYLDEANQSTGYRGVSLPLCCVHHYKLNYLLFSHPIFPFFLRMARLIILISISYSPNWCINFYPAGFQKIS